MDIKRWKLLQSFLFSGVVIYVAVTSDTNPEMLITALVAINGVTFGDLAAIKTINIRFEDDDSDSNSNSK